MQHRRGEAIANSKRIAATGLNLRDSQSDLREIGPVGTESQEPLGARILSHPSRFVQRCKLKSGIPVLIRAISSSDESVLARFHETLSDQSVHFRYLSFIKLSERIAQTQLARTCQINDRELALLLS